MRRPLIVPPDHPLKHLFSDPAHVHHRGFTWSRSCWRALQAVAARLSESGLFFHHAKKKQYGPYHDCFYYAHFLLKHDLLGWVNLDHCHSFPSPEFPECPHLPTVALNAAGHWLSKVQYLKLRKHGMKGKPNLAGWQAREPSTCIDNWPHPPTLLIHCHSTEFTEYAVRAVDWCLGWAQGDWAPFTTPPQGGVAYQIMTPLASQALEGYYGVLRTLSKNKIGHIKKYIRRVVRQSATRRRKQEEAARAGQPS